MKVFLLILVCSLHCVLGSISCLDLNGQPVDWYFVLKLPEVVGEYKGYTYLYLDSNDPNSKLGDFQDSTNAVARTVYQIGLYGSNVNTSTVGYVLWNDQTYKNISGTAMDHEQDPNGVYYAHSKATIAFDSNTGFWLAHSAPGFPFQHEIVPSSWMFPKAQTVYAQHFFCVTFSSSLINTFSKFLLNYHAYIYDFNVPSTIPDLSDFKTFVSGVYTNSESSLTFQSLAGTKFIAFGKHGLTHSDMYEDYVAPGLNSGGLWVESWCCGTYGDCCEDSYCQGKPIINPSNPQRGQSSYMFNSITIEKFSFASNMYYALKNNHAKFALSEKNNYVCPSDNNRAISQRNRGGGALCFQNVPLYNFLYSHITGYNATCSN